MIELNEYIDIKSGGMRVIKERYYNAIEGIITINELKKWIMELDNNDIKKIIKDIEKYYRLEMNI